MSDTADLENRINAALDRIAYRVDHISTAPADAPKAADQSDEVANLQAQLDEERLANEQLKARVEVLKTSRGDAAVALKTSAEENAAKARRLEADVQKMRAVNDRLRDNNAKMRAALAEGVAEPHLINKAMLAELEGLRAARAADKAELDAIITELKPLVEEGA